jgi:hypothetical protein
VKIPTRLDAEVKPLSLLIFSSSSSSSSSACSEKERKKERKKQSERDLINAFLLLNSVSYKRNYEVALVKVKQFYPRSSEITFFTAIAYYYYYL